MDNPEKVRYAVVLRAAFRSMQNSRRNSVLYCKVFRDMMRWLSVAAAVLALAACERFQAPPEEVVAERAAARWQAMIDKDVEKAYGFISPGLRSTTPMNVFQGQVYTRTMERKRAEVLSVACEPDVCTAKVKLTYIYRGAMAAMAGQESHSILDERWIRSDGAWWYVPSR